MAVEEAFNSWLNEKLQSFDIEDEVMGSYISSIITTDEADAEKRESLKDILLDLVHGVDVDELCSEILNKWNESHQKLEPESSKSEQFDIGHKVALIMGKQVQPVLKPANRSTEEEQLREAILSRCTFVSSEEEDYDSDGGAATSSQAPPKDLSQNQNVEAVVQAEKERREKLKQEADKKKVSDKVNREKQKQKQEERREKERKRTQKQERRR